MEITDSPHRPGTPEHNEWVRRVFIPGVGPERLVSDRAKYGAEAIGSKLVRATEVSASGYARGGKSSGIYTAATNKMLTFTVAFKNLDKALMQAFGFSDDEIKREEDRARRDRLDSMWVTVPDWVWETMGYTQRASLGMVRVQAVWAKGEDHYFDHGRHMPRHGPAKPIDNRLARRMGTLPPLRPQPLCPRHGGPAYKCGPCQRSSHAAR